MVLTNPAALWLLALLPIPFLLARRRRPIAQRAVSNLYLWQTPVARESARPTLRRIRRDWLVVVQTAFIGAVILALTRPMLASSTLRVAFVVDVSASMGANDAGA